MLPREQYSNLNTSPQVEWIYVSSDLFTQRYPNAQSSWKGCTVGKHAFDLLRALGSVTALGDNQLVLPQTQSDLPAIQITPIHPRATFTIPPSIPSTTHTAQKASPGLGNVNPVASPTPTSRSTGRLDTPTSVSRQPVSDQASKNADIESNMLDGLTSAGEHSAQKFDVTTEPKAPSSTFVAPQTLVPPLSLHQSSITGYEVYQAPHGGIIIGSITIRPGAQTTVDQGVMLIDSATSASENKISAVAGIPILQAMLQPPSIPYPWVPIVSY